MNGWMDKEVAHSVCLCVCLTVIISKVPVPYRYRKLQLLPHTVNNKKRYLANKGSLVTITYALLPTPSCGIHKRKGKEADQDLPLTPDTVAWMQR